MASITYQLPAYPALSGAFLATPEAAQLAGRDAFYAALAAVAANVLRDLESSCMGALAETPTPVLAFAPPGHMQDIEPIGSRVAAWAARHNLAVEWLIEDAIWALIEARIDGAPVRLCAHERRVDLTSALHAGTVTVSRSIAWHVTGQPRDVFRRIARDMLDRELDAELDRIEAEALAAGAVRIEKRKLDLHARWLALRVVRRMSPAMIADAEAETDSGPDGGHSEKVIREEINEVAAIIGFRSLPKLKPGPQRGSRKSAR